MRRAHLPVEADPRLVSVIHEGGRLGGRKDRGCWSGQDKGQDRGGKHGFHPTGLYWDLRRQARQGAKTGLPIRIKSLFHRIPEFLRGCSVNIYEAAIRILPLFPDAQIAADDDGQIVIMTGVKKAEPPPPGTPLFVASKWYLQPCIRLEDYCIEQGIALDAAWAAINDSDISFGGNDDTLITEQRLCRLLGVEPPDQGRFLISLGC